MADPTEHQVFVASYTPQGGLLIHGQLSEAEAERAVERASRSLIGVEHLKQAIALHLRQTMFAPVKQDVVDTGHHLDSELNDLESAIATLAQTAQRVIDAAETRGARIDAMLTKIDDAMAALSSD
jgi:hypothetical protein